MAIAEEEVPVISVPAKHKQTSCFDAGLVAVVAVVAMVGCSGCNGWLQR